jgi:hypothetical protein
LEVVDGYINLGTLLYSARPLRRTGQTAKIATGESREYTHL